MKVCSAADGDIVFTDEVSFTLSKSNSIFRQHACAASKSVLYWEASFCASESYALTSFNSFAFALALVVVLGAGSFFGFLVKMAIFLVSA